MTLTEIQSALAQLGTRPRQSLGQNFLCDENLARWIVGQLGLQPGDHAVEIGPGLGSLTEILQPAAEKLTLLEKDGRMAQWLARRFPAENVELFHGDALDFDLRKLHGTGPVRIIGNLPYYVSTPLIAKFTSALSPASILVLTLQQEVAERLAARPHSKAYGAMTICVSRHWRVKILKKLPPSVFFPRPQVHSAVIFLERKSAAEIPPCDDMLFESLVRRGFSERRKQLRNLLPDFRARQEEICTALGVAETVRAEELSLDQWERMAGKIAPAAAQKDAEIFDVVDESDRVIGAFSRREVHVNNLRHRAAHILLFNAAGELFLQKRSRWKDLNPGRWDSSAAGHLDSGETYAECAQRELREELGVSGPLEKIGRLPCCEQTGQEFIEVFRGTQEGPFQFAPLEVETGAFFPPGQIRRWLRRSPEEFSPVFRLIVETMPEALAPET